MNDATRRAEAPRADLDLGNGLKVLLVQDNRLPLGHLHLCFRAGSAQEEAVPSGTAHLCEHLKHHGGEAEDGFTSALQRIGGRANAITFHDRMSFTTTLPTAHLDQGLDIEAARLGRPLDADLGAAIALNKKVLLQERTQRLRSRAFEKTLEEVHRLLYPADHPYHAPPAGLDSGIEQIRESDVRCFSETWLTLRNAVLVLVGDFDLEAARRSVERTFGKVAGGAPPPRPVWRDSSGIEPAARWGYEAAPRAEVVFATRGPGFGEPGQIAAAILVRALAIGRTSPLQRWLASREGGAQEVRICFQTMRRASTLAIVAKARPEVDLGALEAAVVEALQRIVRQGLDPSWLERGRKKALKDHFTKLQDLAARADLLAAWSAFHDAPASLHKEAHDYAAVTLDELDRSARDLLDLDRAVLLRRGSQELVA